MKRPGWLVSVLLVAISVGSMIVFVPWDLAYAYLIPLPDTVQLEVAQSLENKLDGVIVYINRKGQKPQFYSAGWRDRQAKIAADPHALFKIGSISKLYIAVATTRLIAEDRLSLNDTLAHLLPETIGHITNADRITLRMLIQHRSGIANFVEDPRFRWDRFGNSEQALSLVQGQPADFAPDSRYHYSNTNYILIGRILDRTLGYNHQDYIKAEFLKPLKLTHTFGRLGDVSQVDVASGYDVGYAGDMKLLDITTPGGSMVATADDVGVFLRALNDGSILSKKELAIYTSIYPSEHTGLVPGYESIARYHKDIDTVLVVFVSTTGGNSWGKIEAIESRVVRILRKKTRIHKT